MQRIDIALVLFYGSYRQTVMPAVLQPAENHCGKDLQITCEGVG
jgi:hypothetical protein